MDTVVAVHRAASAFAVVIIALSIAAAGDPQVYQVLVLICADPYILGIALIMLALAVPELPGRAR